METDRSVISFLRPYLAKYALGLFFGLLAMLGAVAAPFFLRQAVDAISRGEPYLPAVAGMLLVSLFAGVSSWSQRRLSIVASREVEADIRRELFARLLKLDFYFYQDRSVGDLMNRLNTDLQAVRDMLGPGVNMGFRVFAFILAAFAAMFYVNAGLAALVLLAALPAFLAARVFLRLEELRWREAQAVYDEIVAQVEESVAGIRVIKGFGAEGLFERKFLEKNEEYIEKNLKRALVEGPMQAVMSLLMGLGVLAVLYFGGREVIQGRMSLGEFVQFNAYLALLSWPVLGIAWVLGLFQRGRTSFARLLELFSERPRIAEPEGARPPEGSGVRFSGVELSLKGHRVLKGVSLEVPEGKTLGLTGRTGSGKTTLLNLVPRLIDPDGGRVEVGGVATTEAKLVPLRKKIGFAPQEPFLFSDTIFENIAFGLDEPDRKRVEWAAQVAGIHEEILRFPKGYDTVLGERGVTLSGGQRQRVALARALAKDPEILILDDALSAVDAETEARILKNLKEVFKGRTTIIASHRVTALAQAERVAVLERGRVVEEGSYEELLKKGGYLAELARLQRVMEEL